MHPTTLLFGVCLALFQGQTPHSRSPEDTFRQAFKLVQCEGSPKAFAALFAEPQFATLFQGELQRAEKELGKLKIASLRYEDARKGASHRLIVTYQAEKRPDRPYQQIVYVECPRDSYIWVLENSGTISYRSHQETPAPPG